MRDMKEIAMQYTTFGYAQTDISDTVKVVLPPHSLEVVAEILDCEIEAGEIEQYEINIEDKPSNNDTLSDLSTLKVSQYKLLRCCKFGHTPKFTRVELVAMDDVITTWLEMNGEFEEEPSKESYYACIALHKITKAIQHM